MHYTIDYFKNIAQERGGECLSTEYKNCKAKLEFKCSCGNVWRAEPRHIVAGRWCPVCGHQSGRKYDVNHEFFSKDDEITFYVAGFLAADGWKTKKGNGAYSVGLQLAAKDEKHIRTIRELMGCTSPLKFRRRKNKSGTTSFSYTFVANSKQMYSDLDRFCVTENKTYTLEMKDWLSNHHLVRHFMRGYIDGDGCFVEVQDSVPHIHFSMRGTKVFLEQFHNVLKENGVVDDDRVVIANAGKKDIVFGKLQYGGNGVISRLYRFLYDDAKIFLPRKEEIAKRALVLASYGDGTRERKVKSTALPITKEILLEKAKELKSGQKIAKHFGCTPANISWWVKNIGIQNEYHKALGQLDYDLVVKRYSEAGNYTVVAKEFGVTKQRISQIVKRASGV
jgi:hypothetical protein